MQEKPPIHISKRIFDLIVSIALLTILSPVIIVFLILIFLEHIGRGYPFAPLLYSEIRWSAGKPFTLYKFNIFKHDMVMSMRARGEFIYTKNLERNGHLINVGKLLRQIYLDELPQLINVLKGDMSIVGPRPINTAVRTKLMKEGFSAKDKVKAGMTGYYQAVRKSQKSLGTQERLDTYYVEHYLKNPWYKHMLFDLKIIALTIVVLIMAKGV